MMLPMVCGFLAVTVSVKEGLDQTVVHSGVGLEGLYKGSRGAALGDSRSSSTESALLVIVTVNLEKRSVVAGTETLRIELWWLTYILRASHVAH